MQKHIYAKCTRSQYICGSGCIGFLRTKNFMENVSKTVSGYCGCRFIDWIAGEKLILHFVCQGSFVQGLPYFNANLQTGGVPYEVSMALRVGKAAP